MRRNVEGGCNRMAAARDLPGGVASVHGGKEGGSHESWLRARAPRRGRWPLGELRQPGGGERSGGGGACYHREHQRARRDLLDRVREWSVERRRGGGRLVCGWAGGRQLPADRGPRPPLCPPRLRRRATGGSGGA